MRKTIKRVLQRTRKCRVCGKDAKRYECKLCGTYSWCSQDRPCANGCYGKGCGREGALERSELP